MLKLGGENALVRYLTAKEQEHLNRLTAAKRRREWLGARFAAKYTAAEILSRPGSFIPWFSIGITADAAGRPYLLVDEREVTRSDISISHSGDLAGAMVVRRGLCGIDIQKITNRVVKVRERFCTPDEERLLYSTFDVSRAQYETYLTLLWSAKEALRKVAKNRTLPGFLELVLTQVSEDVSRTGPAVWKFTLARPDINGSGNQAHEEFSVRLWVIKHYTLALTITNDTIGGETL